MGEAVGGGDATGRLDSSPFPGLGQLARIQVQGIEGWGELLGDETEQGCTTPLIVSDAEGNVVVATQSLGLHFGSGVVAEGTGVLLNSDMSNFAFKTPESLNMVAPGKWPRSTIAPTLVLQNGRPVFAASGAGGGRIPPVVTQVLADLLDFDRDPLETVRQARFHPRRLTGGAVLDLEGGLDPKVLAALKDRGWGLDPRPSGGLYFASVQVLRWYPDGRITGVADIRRSSDAQGANVPD